MTVPDRSELPPEFVAYIEKQNAEAAEYEPPKPILPAKETPQGLVDAAMALDEAIGRHIADGSFAAKLLEHVMRPTIDLALNRKITEPIPNLVVPNKIDDTDIRDPRRRDLETAYVKFRVLVEGIDKSAPFKVASLNRTVLMVRKHVAKSMGVELDLTDEQWWEL